LTKEESQKKTLEDLQAWWTLHTATKNPVTELTNLKMGSIPNSILARLNDVGVVDIDELKEVISTPFSGSSPSDVSKYLTELRKNSPRVNLIDAKLDTSKIFQKGSNFDSKTINTILSDLEKRYEEAKVIYQVSRNRGGKEAAEEQSGNILKELNQQIKDVKSIQQLAKSRNTSLSTDDEIRKLDGERIVAIKALKQEGIEISEFASTDIVLRTGKNAKNYNTQRLLEKLNNNYKFGPVAPLVRLTKSVGSSYGISLPANINKLSIQETSAAKAEALKRPVYKEVEKAIAENEKLKDISTTETIARVKAEVISQSAKLGIPVPLTDAEIDLELLKPENAEKFQNILLEFSELAKKDRFDLIKNRIQTAKTPLLHALAQTARRAIVNDKWNSRRKELARAPSLLIEKSALDGNYAAIVLPEAGKVLSDEDLLDSAGFIDFDKIDSLSEASRTAVRKKLVQKYESYEIKSRLTGQLAHNQQRISKYGLFLSQQKVSDPSYEGKNISLGNLISRYVVEEIADQVGENYAELKDRYNGDLTEIRTNLEAYWRDRGNSAESLGTFKAMCRKAVERAVADVDMPSQRKLSASMVKDEFIQNTSDEYESLVIGILKDKNKSAIITPQTIFDVDFASKDENATTGTAIRLTERSVGKASSYNAGQLPAGVVKNNLVEEVITKDFFEGANPNDPRIQKAILNIGHSIEEADEDEGFFGKSYGEIQYTPSDALKHTEQNTEEFNIGARENAEFLFNSLFHPELAKEKSQKDREDLSQRAILNIAQKIFGSGTSQDLQSIFEKKKLAGFYSAVFKNPKVLYKALWDGGVPLPSGGQFMKGGIKKLISNKLMSLIGIRRKIDAGDGHHVEVNIVTRGILGRIDNLIERFISTKFGKFFGLDNSLSFSNRKRRKSIVETVLAVTINAAASFVKALLVKIGLFPKIQQFINNRIFEFSGTAFGSTMLGTIDAYKVFRHYGAAGISGVQNAFIGGLIGSVIAGPIGATIGAAAFGGQSFFSALYRNNELLKDAQSAFARIPQTGLYSKFGGMYTRMQVAFGQGSAFPSVIANAGESVFARLSRTLSELSKKDLLLKGFGYFKSGTIVAFGAIILGANPLLAFSLGLGSVALQYSVEKGIALLAKTSPVLKIVETFRILGKFPVFDALGVGFGVSYAIEQFKLLGKLINGEITPYQFANQLLLFSNIGNGIVSTVFLVTGVSALARIGLSVITPVVGSVLTALGVTVNVVNSIPILSRYTLIGGVIGGIVGALLGLGPLGIAITSACGALGGLIGGVIGLAVGGWTAIPFFIGGTSIGTAIGYFLGKAVDGIGLGLQALGGVLGLFRLFRAKGIMDFAQSVIMLALSLGGGTAVGLSLLTLIPSVASLGIIEPTNTLIIFNKTFDKKISDTELQYSIKIASGRTTADTIITGIEVVDTVIDPSNIESISKVLQESSSASSFRISGNTVTYTYNAIQATNSPTVPGNNASVNSFNPVTYTYIVKLKKPLQEVAANSNLCNSLDGSVTAKQISTDESVEPILLKDPIKQIVCIDKDGKLVRTAPIKGLFRPELGGLPVDPKSAVSVTQCSNSAVGGSHNNEKAIDIAGTKGFPIFAWEDGVVTHTQVTTEEQVQSLGFGTDVVIKHNIDGKIYYTTYAHLMPTVNGLPIGDFIKVGDTVSKGQQIGEMGTTGNSSGPHLHFQIQSTDPQTSNGASGKLEPCCYISCSSLKPSGSFPNEGCVDFTSSFWSNVNNSCVKNM